jgi:hypothetical protein
LDWVPQRRGSQRWSCAWLETFWDQHWKVSPYYELKRPFVFNGHVFKSAQRKGKIKVDRRRGHSGDQVFCPSILQTGKTLENKIRSFEHKRLLTFTQVLFKEKITSG